MLTSEPLSDTHSGVFGPCDIPQALTSDGSVRRACPGWSDTRLCCVTRGACPCRFVCAACAGVTPTATPAMQTALAATALQTMPARRVRISERTGRLPLIVSTSRYSEYGSPRGPVVARATSHTDPSAAWFTAPARRALAMG